MPESKWITKRQYIKLHPIAKNWADMLRLEIFRDSKTGADISCHDSCIVSEARDSKYKLPYCQDCKKFAVRFAKNYAANKPKNFKKTLTQFINHIESDDSIIELDLELEK